MGSLLMKREKNLERIGKGVVCSKGRSGKGRIKQG